MDCSRSWPVAQCRWTGDGAHDTGVGTRSSGSALGLGAAAIGSHTFHTFMQQGMNESIRSIASVLLARIRHSSEGRNPGPNPESGPNPSFRRSPESRTEPGALHAKSWTPACAAVTLLIALLAGCGTDSSQASPAPLVRDSAGIRIVEHIAPQWAAGEGWSLAAEPVTIGSLAGAPEDQLFNVAAVKRLDDGRLLVANRGTGELRFYSAAGAYERTIGRSGSGPGEFRSIAAVEQHADSFFVIDQTLRRISVFTLEGDFVRDFTIPLVRHLANPSGIFADGTLLFGGIDIGIERGEVVQGRARDPMRYFRISGEGEVLDSLGPFLGPERMAVVSSEGGRTAVRIEFAEFSAVFTIRAGGDVVLTALGEEYEFGYLQPDGIPDLLVRRPHSPRAVTEADLARQLRLREEAMASRGGPAIPAMPTVLSAENFSAYGPVVQDRIGNTWVSEYRPLWEEGPARWSVFDPQGVWLGEVEIPEKMQILEIGSDYLIGLFRDDLDVEYVRVYSIDKP